jgi:6-phosphogluconolactonase
LFGMSAREVILIGKDLGEAVDLAAEQVALALSAGGPRFVALSGGKTPSVLYETLPRPPWRDRVDWSGIHWFWGDERTVPPDHPDSNYRMARQTLLSPLGVPAERLHRMPADAGDLSAAARQYEQTIRRLVPAGSDGIPVFDLILLGVGHDGHTASLFPGSPALAVRDQLVVSCEVPALRTWRMTMTLPLLQAARRIVFLVTGAEKADIMAQVLGPPAGPGLLPAAGVRGAAGLVAWVLDAQTGRLV